MSSKKFGITSALAATAFTVGIIAAPTASAAPVNAATFTPLIGLGGTGSSGDFPVFETITALTDTAEPGVTRFGADAWCKCRVNWTNATTGQTGSLHVGRQAMVGPDIDRAVTGSGQVSAVAVVDYGFATLLPGRANWVVP